MALLELAFPADAGKRVVIEIGAADEKGFVVETERGVGFELKAANEVVACRDEHDAAAGIGAGVDRFLESSGILDLAFSGGAEIHDVKKCMGRRNGFVRLGVAAGFRRVRCYAHSNGKNDERGDEMKKRTAGKKHGWSGVNTLGAKRGIRPEAKNR